MTREEAVSAAVDGIKRAWADGGPALTHTLGLTLMLPLTSSKWQGHVTLP